MQSTSCTPALSQAGHIPSAGCPPVQITLKDHIWSLCEYAARSVPRCVGCMDEPGTRHSCIDKRHCICAPCYESTIQVHGHVRCPQCRTTDADPADLKAWDKQLAWEQQQQQLRLNCAECLQWNGTLAQLGEHARACPKPEFSCARASFGCPWTGPMTAMADHNRVCEPKLQELRQWFPALAAVPQTTGPTMTPTMGFSMVPVKEYPMPCGWGCDFQAPPAQMAAHYEHCRFYPMDCPHCEQKYARGEWLSHVRSCDQQIVSCPKGCGEPGLRQADVVSNGPHALTCPAVPKDCTYCHVRFPHVETHELRCDLRPVQCRWCLDSHPQQDFEKTSAHCITKLQRDQKLGSYILTPHPCAQGPVYVRQGLGIDTVFIKLPKSLFTREMGKTSHSEYLMPDVLFDWAEWRTCRIELRYSPDKSLFFLRLRCAGTYDLDKKSGKAELYGADGDLIESLGSPMKKAAQEKRISMWKGSSEEVKIQAINSIAGYKGNALYLQLSRADS